MMANTQTIQRGVINPTRAHDHIYDKTYTVSDDRDHARALFRAKTNVSKVRIMPKFGQMFSTLKNFPNHTYRLENVDAVPAHMSRQWPGYAEQRREALVRHATFNYCPDLPIPEKSYGDSQAHVRSHNRAKYFRRPIIPFLTQVAPEILLQPAAVDPLAPPNDVIDRPLTPPTRTVQQQTDYRESEAQTDPYTPEYVIRPGSAPEVLTLATLSYKHGLPAGLAEVEMIERARAKRAWEKTLPPLNDISQLQRRKRMMEAMETKEWSFREKEIEELQAIRLEVLQRLLYEREAKQQEINEKRLDKLWSGKQKEKEKKAARTRREHIKTLRKILKRRDTRVGEVKKRELIEEYGGFTSQTHAPYTRLGVFLDRASEQYVVRSKYLDSYQGLLELENSLPDYVRQPQFKIPEKPPKEPAFVKKADRLYQHLEELYQDIQKEKKTVKRKQKLRFLHKIEKMEQRPPTPAVATPSKQGEEMEIAAITLQKVIRGRAVQNMMYEGKENRRELIAELKTTHALLKSEQQIKLQEKQQIISLQRQRKLYEDKQNFVDEALSQLEGEPVGDLLDYLSKELIRLQEERKIHAFCMLAERRRRLREAEEAGRRQTEERRRREEDEIFKQIVKIHQQTVDTYLEDIIMESVNDTAAEQARVDVQQHADKINDIAYAVEKTKTKLESEEIVAEMVHSFLLPEIMKKEARKKVSNNQRKHLMAAHTIVNKTMKPVTKMVSPREIYGEHAVDGKKPVREEKTEFYEDEPYSYAAYPTAPEERPSVLGFLQNQEDVELFKIEQEETRKENERIAAETAMRLAEEAAAEAERLEKLEAERRAKEAEYSSDEF